MVTSLNSVHDDRVRAYIVWLPIFGGDFEGESRKLPRRLPDKRVSYFMDPESLTGELWERVLETKREIAWDVYLLYGSGARWENELPPAPDFWMQQLTGVTKAPRLDEPKFTQTMREMLHENKKPDPTRSSNPVNRVKVEFLYFPRCPTHKQALANLKSALQDSNLEVDLQLISVASEAQAEKVGFQGSPSIRINGKDLDGRDDEYSYACRIYRIDGRITAVPTEEFIRERLKKLQ
jgi:hypothetical protein